jgi:hypothetical protein
LFGFFRGHEWLLGSEKEIGKSINGSATKMVARTVVFQRKDAECAKERKERFAVLGVFAPLR